MKKQSDTYRFCFVITLGLMVWQVSGCAKSTSTPTIAESAQRESSAGESVSLKPKPKLLKKAPAVYPPAALDHCLGGTVWVMALVGVSGEVQDVKVGVASDTDVGFEAAAMTAAGKSKFAPGMRDGKPKSMWATFPYSFSPPEDCDQSQIEATPTQNSAFVAHEAEPKFIFKVKPKYPKAARARCLEGTVHVQALVDKTGKVSDVKIAKASGTDVGFEKAAMEAAKKTKFIPALQSGRPIALWVNFPYEFKPPNNCSPAKSNLRKPPFSKDSSGLQLDESVEYDTPPQFLTKPAPIYPRMALSAGLSGTVWVSVFINTQGIVEDVTIAEPSHKKVGFEQASIDAAWKTKFKPAMLGGEPIAVWVTFPLKFMVSQ